MSIQIYNSLTKTKEALIPVEDKTIRMYACGVTVYDKCHIGHARSLYVFHVIKQYLLCRGFDVHFVRNITDVDDKIINKAKELNKSFQEVVDENIVAYKRDLKNLDLPEADIEPRATENIKEMVAHIEKLIQDDYAYEVEGNVYYNVRKFKGYGKLSGQEVEKMQEAVRIEIDEHKKDPLDFALWKKAGAGEPSWDSPWGKGRPGWHIECSCMSMKYLNTQTLDIHAGGRDLIFPHHENEIAQSEALTHKPFAKYWIHHGLLTINGQKMSKSLGNFITVDEALEKYSVEQLKYFYLSSHYASPIDFTDDKLVEAKKALGKFEILKQRIAPLDQNVKLDEENEFIKNRIDAFTAAMDDDFNTPKALGVLFEFLTDINKLIDENNDQDNLIVASAQKVFNILEDIFGISLEHANEGETLEKEVQDLLDERRQARDEKNYARSDEIRDQLKEIGYAVEDGKEGQTVRKI